jgi:CubicO group peptidase (beta-lactamase class C family)
MTKIATATAVVRLHAAGVLNLDAPVDRYLAEYPAASGRRPTVRQLLNHTAGLANPLPIRWVRPESAPLDQRALDKVLAKHGRPKRAPGGAAAYSNIGFLLAGRVVEAVTGRSVQDCVAEQVLHPLGMDETGYAYPSAGPRATGYARLPRAAVPMLRAVLPRGIVDGRARGHTALRPFLVNGAAYGGLIGTAADAARLAAAHAAAEPDPHPVLGHDDVVMMRTINAPGKPFDHGLGWFRKPAYAGRTPAFVEHYGTGVGYWNAMRVYPAEGLAMVAMTNTTTAWGFDRLFEGLRQLPCE